MLNLNKAEDMSLLKDKHSFSGEVWTSLIPHYTIVLHKDVCYRQFAAGLTIIQIVNEKCIYSCENHFWMGIDPKLFFH